MANSEKPLRVSVNHRPADGNRDEPLEERYYCNLTAGGVRLSHWYPTYESAIAAATVIACAVKADGFWVANGTAKPEFIKI